MFLLYHSSTRPTGRTIAQALGLPFGRENRRGVTPMIRWGNAMEHGAQTFLNQREAILRASHKLSALRTMREAGVRVPDFETAHQRQGIWMARQFHGSQGRDIAVFENDRLLHGRAGTRVDFFTRYIPNTREYRIHVVKDEVVRIQGKYLDFPDEHDNPFIKNHDQGYRFRAPNRRLNQERTDMAKQAVACLGLDFGAVDLVVGEDRLTYVLEVNTAPACSPLTAAGYVTAFHRRMVDSGMRVPDPNFDALRVLAPQGD